MPGLATFAGRVALVASIALASVTATFAQQAAVPATAPAAPPSKSALDKQLAGFDPKAVTAARHYFGQPAVRVGMVSMIDNMDKAMAQQIGRQNPAASPEQIAKFQKIASDALKQRLDLILDMNMVNTLQTFTTGEIVALDTFYSSPDGASILAKMPKVLAALPEMVRSILPDYFADVQAKVKAAGGDFKL